MTEGEIFRQAAAPRAFSTPPRRSRASNRLRVFFRANIQPSSSRNGYAVVAEGAGALARRLEGSPLALASTLRGSPKHAMLAHREAFVVDVPDIFTQAFVMEKDSKRFPDSGG
jgi:hypothetical protein